MMIMNQTSSTSQTLPNYTHNEYTPAKTLSSFCNSWMNTKEEAVPSICHWFIHPQDNKKDSLLKFNPDPEDYISSFPPTDNGHMSRMDHRILSTEDVSLIFILCGILFILLVTALMTCITRKKRTQQPNEEDYLNNQVSEQMERIRSANLLFRMERLHPSQKKDAPPDYVTAVKMKEEEDEELPTYSEAVIRDTDIK